MEITSPGILSDCIFHRFAGKITDRGTYTTVYTVSNPSYYYGNFLIFAAPPKSGEFTKWMSLFHQEFADDDAVGHHTFQWQSGKADAAAIKEFTDQGFTYDNVSVLTATGTHIDREPPNGMTYRKLETDTDWLAAKESQIAAGFPSIPTADYRIYKEAQFANYRDMADAGLGGWFGAFKGDELVANMGLFFDQTIGRFQSVETLKAHRRQGICSALVQYVSQWGFAHRPGVTLMIHADHDDIPSRLYQSLGYREVEVLESVFRPPSHP